jgi:hypothetical protein
MRTCQECERVNEETEETSLLAIDDQASEFTAPATWAINVAEKECRRLLINDLGITMFIW